MADQTERINQLLAQIQSLAKRQNEFEVEIQQMLNEVRSLRSGEQATFQTASQIQIAPEAQLEAKTFSMPVPSPELQKSGPSVIDEVMEKLDLPKVKTDFEKFIGENLINKIGIAITVIGVSFGAKYAIDHQLISPLTRIVLGYLFGLGLLGFAIKLRPKYENFSAVLLSGAMAILYFMTYAAYSFYGLIPQAVAFGMMAVITAFTVFAALKYDNQVSTHRFSGCVYGAILTEQWIRSGGSAVYLYDHHQCGYFNYRL